MSRACTRLLTLFLVAATAGPATSQTFTQPATGAAGTWNTAALWTPGIPTSSSSTALVFNVLGGNANAYTFTNDIGPFTANSLTFNHFGTAGLTVALGANALTLDGTNPFFAIGGPGGTTISGAGGITLNANTAVTGAGAGTLTIASVVSGAGGLTVNTTGQSIVNLTGANTFTGGVTLTNGFLQLGTASALGAAGNVLTVNGGAVRFGGVGATIPNNITANANLVIAGGSGGVSATTSHTLTGVISGAGGLTLRNYNTTAGAILQGANTYTGPTVINPALPYPIGGSAPILTLSGTGGTIATTSAITVGQNATLSLANTATAANTNRVGDATPVTLNGGRFTFTSGAAGTNESVGALTVSGLGRLNTTATGVSDLTFAGFARVGTATVILESASFGTINSATNATRVFFTGQTAATMGVLAAGSGTGQETGVVPYMIASSSTNPRAFVTYDATNGLQVIPHSNTTYVLNQTAGAVAAATVQNKNVHFNGAGTYTLTGANTINALTTTSSTVTVSGGTLTVFSGVITNFDSLVFDNVNLDFQTRTAFLHNSWHFTVRGTSAVNGSGGVVVSAGASGRALLFDNSVPNPFTGGLTVNGSSSVGFFRDDQLGAAGGAITLAGGGLAYNAAANATISRPISIGAANGAFGFNQTNSNAGNTATAATAATTVTLSGVISGPGAFVKDGVGAVNLTGANTFDGGVMVNAGTLQFTADNNLGAAGRRVVLNGGTLQPLAAVTTDRPIDVNASSTILANVDATLSGPLSNVGTLYGTALPTLTKSGTGTVTLSAASPNLSGTLAVSAGTLRLAGTAAVPQVNAVQVSTGGTFAIDNRVDYVADRMNDRAAVNLGGGTLLYFVPVIPAADPFERFGVLTASAAGSVLSIDGTNAAGPGVLRFSGLNATAALTIRGTDLGGTSGNYTRVLFDSLTANAPILQNVFFAGTPGTTPSSSPAAYDTVRGVILFTPTPVSGTSINNLAPDNVPLIAAYTTAGNTTAATGASVFSLTLDGGSTLTLNGGNAASAANGNTPDGTLFISGGQLASQNGAKSVVAGSFAAPTVSFGAAAAVVTTTSDLTIGAGVTLAGTSGLTKAGAGTLTINGTYAVSGGLTMSAGTLASTVALAPGAVTMNGGTINTNGNNLTITSLSGTTGTLNVGAGTLTINQATNTTYAGNIISSTGFVKTGGTATVGFLTLSSATPLGYTGAAQIREGGVILGASNVLPAAQPVVIGLPSLGNTAFLDLNGNNQTVSGLTFYAKSSGGAAAQVTGAGTLTVNGPIATLDATASVGNAFPVTVASAVNLGGAVRDVTVAGNNNGGGDLVFSAPITNGGINYTGVDSTGVTNIRGVLTLNAANTYAGGTTINAGTVIVGAAGSLGTGLVTMTTATTPSNLTFQGSSTVGGLASGTLGAGAATVNLSGGVASTVTINQSVNTTFGGNITGTGGLAKAGTGTLILSGTNGQTGAVAVTGGRLLVNGSLAGAATPPAVTVSGTGVFGGTGTLGTSGATRNVVVNTGGTLAPGVGGGAAAGTLTQTGNLTVNGGGAIRATLLDIAYASATDNGMGRINVTGDVAIDPAALLRLDLSAVSLADMLAMRAAVGEGSTRLYTVATASGTLTNFSALDAAGSNYGFYSATEWSLVTGTTGVIQVRFTAAPVPEPASLLAVAAAALGVGRLARRRRAIG